MKIGLRFYPQGGSLLDIGSGCGVIAVHAAVHAAVAAIHAAAVDLAVLAAVVVMTIANKSNKQFFNFEKN